MLPPSGCWRHSQVEPWQGAELKRRQLLGPPPPSCPPDPACWEKADLQRLIRLTYSVLPEGPNLAKSQPRTVHMARNLPKGPILKKHCVQCMCTHPYLSLGSVWPAQSWSAGSPRSHRSRGGTSVPPTLAIFTQNRSIPTETVWLQNRTGFCQR